MEIAYAIALFGIGLVILQFGYANMDNFLTVPQMFLKGFERGLPLIYHAGVWGDLLVVTPVAFWIVYAYSGRWSLSGIFISSLIGLVLTVAMVIFWISLTKHGLPEALAHGGKLTNAGFFHALFMFGAATIFLLFFFNSDVSQNAATMVAIILVIHLFCSSHIPLGLYGPEWFPARPHKDPATWAVLAISWGMLAWRCLTIR